ncbi:acyltransferase family protein [Nonomuraea soli]|uniref:Peptidoglycan/LPS O-acetylase OafA/YrhL n=1 Tax=Nonomuraea soli TaxID=1032476 RepID=A0A7W0CKD9_9ACTN|nr:acyltransferase [Nonomuraea soli]MBA2892783.1 peptidoglycan/LPS O-acetylase OafA/YrhL [Nonomuraea soli]
MTETGSTPRVDGHQTPLDGVRAVAAFVVLTFHVAMETGAGMQPGFYPSLLARGDVAVPIFFALSGLLLYRPWAMRLLLHRPGPDLRSYFRKRALRILPAYWLVVVTAMLLWSREHLDNVVTWIELLLLGQVYDMDQWWAPNLGPRGLAQMWSLSVEVSFYLALPLIAWALDAFARRGGQSVDARAKRLLLGLGVLAALSYVWCVLTYYPVHSPSMSLWLPRGLTYFSAGMILTVVAVWAVADPEGRGARLSRALAGSWGSCWLAAAFTYAIAATPISGPRFFGIDHLWTSMFELMLYTVVAFFLLAPVAADASLPGRLLGSPVMAYLGRISYGIFLWQFVVLYAWYELTGQQQWTGGFLTNLLAVSAITVAVSDVSYRLVERPLQRLGARARSRPAPAPAEPAEARS